MVNDKNRLYTREDATKDAKHTNKVRTQQQFSRFTAAGSTALISASTSSNTSPALQIETKPQIGNPINDTIGTITGTPTAIELDIFGSDYSTLIIDQNVLINFDRIPRGRHIPFTIDFVIDTVTPPTVTLDVRVINAPTLPTLTNGLRVVLNFIGVVDDVDTRFIYIGGTIGGAGGLSEPVILTINTITPQTLPTKSTIDWSKNPNHITINKDVEFDFSNLPASGSYEGVLVIIDIDATGGYAAPLWPASLVNPPVVPTTANTRTSVMLYTIDAGTTVTHATSVGSSSSAEFLGPWTANHDAGIKSLTNVALVQYVDTGGVVRGTISGDAGAKLIVAVPASGEFIIQEVVTPIAEFDSVRIDFFKNLSMVGNAIKALEHFVLDGTIGLTLTTEAGMEYNQASSYLRYNVPTTGDFHRWDINGESMALLSRFGANEGLLTIEHITVVKDIGIGTILDLATFTNSTPSNGNIWLDLTTGNFQFRQNGATIGLAAGAGDMLLGTVQTVTALKTFENATIGFRNQADTFTGLFTNAITATRTWTMPDATDTIIGKSTVDTLLNKTYDLGGTGNVLTGSTAEFNTALQLDSFCYLGTVQIITALKTFENATIGLRNQADTFTGLFTNAITTTRTWTLPDATDTLMGVSTADVMLNKTFDLGNNTLTGSVAEFNAAVQSESFGFLGTAQTWTAVQTHTANIISSGGTHDIGNATTGQFNSLYLDNTLFCSNLKVWTGDSDINVFNDLDMQAGDTVDFADTSTTAGTSSQTLPAQPDGFIIIKVNGVTKRVPFYVP